MPLVKFKNEMIDNYKYESELYKQGINLIAGIDEVGRGPLIGPVVASCVVLPKNYLIEGLTDSKKVSKKKRDELYDLIMSNAVAIGVGIIYEDVIDEVNIYQATKLAMRKAFDKLFVKPEHVLIDAMPLELEVASTSIIKGDLKSHTIAAASIVAKVTRDRMMEELDLLHPEYDFKNNMGYPTKKHLEAIEKYGILKEHRKSYAPIKNYIL